MTNKKTKKDQLISSFMIQQYKRRTEKSCLPQSTRRIFFTHCNDPVSESGFYFADWLGGMGTGILLKYVGRFFLLTTRHEIFESLSKQQNESPFFVLANSKASTGIFEIQNLLFPRWRWDIRQLIRENKGVVAWNDIELIEFFAPLVNIPKEEYLDLDQVQVICRKQFFEGQYLLASGYPWRLNAYEDPSTLAEPPPTNQYTNICRDHVWGNASILTDQNEPLFKPNCEVDHDTFNGMSGGIVVNLQPKQKNTQWAGLLTKIHTELDAIHFIPAYALINVIRRFAEADRFEIDPAANAPLVYASIQEQKKIETIQNEFNKAMLQYWMSKK
jgi:hypothetical protein